MADALISPVLEQLASYVQQEVKLAVYVRDEVKKLTGTLKVIQGVVEDAERKQVKDKGVKAWLAELKDLVYEADDVLDEWNTKTLISQLNRVGGDVNTASSIRKKVLSYLLYPCSCFKHVVVRYDIGLRIKEIREHLDVIAERRNQFGLTVSQNSDEPRPLTSSFIDVPVIRGRDYDKKVIMEKFLGESSSQAVVLGESSSQAEVPVHVISIVGMGGSGKTTLAKLVYNEEKVVASFEKRIWVCVSEPFDQLRVFKEITEQTTGNAHESFGIQALREKLSDSVKGRRVFLVLDDVWTTDPDHCRQLKFLLDGGSPGSRILVTTRNEEVAYTMESSYTHNLGKLSDEEGWSILCDVALKGRKKEIKDFEKIGRAIASKCKGLPLAIQTLASLLYQKKKKQEWRDILESELWDVPRVENFLLPSLLLSYYSLPSISKQCFLFCAIFPKDSEMKKDYLVKLWMAQGFLGSDETRDLEKLGGYYFDNLAMSSFFQDFWKDSDGSIVSCKMHDLVHDLAEFLTHNECFNMLVREKANDSNKIRHLCTLNFESPAIGDAKNLRTLIRPKESGGSVIPGQLFDKLSCLRTLDLSWSGLKEVPNEVGNLLHLRYLDLSGTIMSELPKTVCSLYNLQTLKLNSCKTLGKIHGDIGNLRKLRHLELQYTRELSFLPQGVKALSSLRTLSKFIVGGESDGCKIEDLALLNKLQGDLEIMGLERVTEANEAAKAELKRKRDICRLTFTYALLDDDEDEENNARRVMGYVLEKLEPPEHLERLKIVRYQGSQFASWMQNNALLDNVVYILLDECVKCEKLPALGKLASLEILVIRNLRSVAHIGNEFYGFGVGNSFRDETSAFPKLKSLWIKSMEQWEDWKLPISKNTKIMPHLTELQLLGCPKLRGLPCLEFGPAIFGDGDGDGVVLFPELKKLSLENMDGLERLTSPYMSVSKVKVMPHLLDLSIKNCEKLRELPNVAIFDSLETLTLKDLPKWTEREEEKGEKHDYEERESRLRSLAIRYCLNLNVVPHSMLSPTLRELYIVNCPQLRGKQPCLPPLLEKLLLAQDVGVFSESLPLKDTESGSSIRRCHINYSPHSSLPKGFNQLKSLQVLKFNQCKSFDFELKEFQQFTMLQVLGINGSPALCQRFKGEEWRSILPHVLEITIDGSVITSTN